MLLLCLFNSPLAPHHLQGPVQTHEHPHICSPVKEYQMSNASSPCGTLCQSDKGIFFSRWMQLLQETRSGLDFSPAPTSSLPVFCRSQVYNGPCRFSSNISQFTLFRMLLPTKSLPNSYSSFSKSRQSSSKELSPILCYQKKLHQSMPVIDFLVYFPHSILHSVKAKTLSFRSACL